MSSSSLIYYFILFLGHIYVDYSMLTHRIIDPRFIIHFSFLTHMSFYLNFVYYTLRFFIVIGLSKNVLDKEFFKNFFQFQYVISFIVFTLFWGMFLSDPHLLSKSNIPVNPYTNLFLHGGNFLFNFFEHLYMNPGGLNNTITRKFYFIFCACYVIYMMIIQKFLGVAIYSFLEDGPIVKVIVIASGFVLLSLGDVIYKNSYRIKSKIN